MAFSWTMLWLGCLLLGLAALARPATESTTRTAPKATHETPAVDLGALLDAGEGAVVTLVAGDTRLAAHRAVLTVRSPHFKAVLSNNSLEASGSQLDIADVEGPVLRQLVAYLYTLQAPQASIMAPQLLAAADAYGVSELKAACERQLVSQLAVDNAATLAALAVRHSCPRLKDAAVAFIRANLLTVMATQAWRHAVVSHPEDMIVVVQLLAEPPAGTSTPSGSSQTTVASTPAPPTGNASLPDDDTVSRYRSLSAAERGRRLLEAAKVGAPGEVRDLLAAGADVEVRDENNDTALHWAAARGHVDVASCLLASGAELDARDTWQTTPLIMAAYHGRTAVVRLLTAASADHNVRDGDGWTPLHHAVEQLHADVVAALLEAGANIRARDNDGKTPLDLATNQKLKQLLAESSTSLSGGGAVSSYSTPAATDSGSAPGQTHSGSSQTPVASTPAPPACNVPLPDDDTVSQYRGLSAAERGRRLLEAAKEGAVGEVRALLAAGADVMARDGDSDTALHWAATKGHVDVAGCLLASGPEVDARNKWEYTPLILAAFWGRPAVVQLLATASADLNARGSDGMTPLHDAARRGHADVAAVLLEAGADRRLRNNDGKTPLDLATNEKLKQLLAESSTSLSGGGAVSSSSTPAAADGGPTPGQTHSGSSQTPAASTPAPPACNAPLPDDDTVSWSRSLSAAERDRRLIEAAKEGAARDVRALLAAGADVGTRDEDGFRYTALHWAAWEGHADVASCLLASGADVDARESGQNTPLHLAAWRGHADVASCLLASGAEVDARNKWEYTPLHRAAHYGHTAVVKLLEAASADLSARRSDGMTPLHDAARRGHAEVAAALLEAGADGSLRNNDGKTPLDLATNQKLKQLLAESSTSLPGGGAVSSYSAPAAADGGSAPGQTHSSGSSQTPAASTPAPPACNAPLPDDDTVSRYRIFSTVEKGRRLRESAKEGAVGEVRALLAAGADVASTGVGERTALHRAAWWGHADVASCLIGGGAEVDARNSWDDTPLSLAAFKGNTAVARLLVSVSADLNARNKAGRTPLHLAASKGHAEVAAVLLEAGADRGVRDIDGKTPLDLASNQKLKQLLAES